MKNLNPSLLVIIALQTSACSDTTINSDVTKRSEQSSLNSESNIHAENLTESVNPPSNISGTYLACEASFSQSGFEHIIELNCFVTKDGSVVEVQESKWFAEINSPKQGEMINLVDFEKGTFELIVDIELDINDTLSRLELSFVGLFAGDLVAIAANAADAIALSELGGLPKPSLAIRSCQENYIMIPGDDDYGTDDFCVMKYEAKDNGNNRAVSQAAGNPWVNITHLGAKNACSDLGRGFSLISNNEWMTIASNIAALPSNWSGASVGSGSLNIGHSNQVNSQACPASDDDNQAYLGNNCSTLGSGDFLQKRTHELSNGELLWDFAGNSWQWIDFRSLSGSQSAAESVWFEYPEMDDGVFITKRYFIPTTAVKDYWDDTWDSNHGVGLFRSSERNRDVGLFRGGDWNANNYSGLFAATFADGILSRYQYVGFRCVQRFN